MDIGALRDRVSQVVVAAVAGLDFEVAVYRYPPGGSVEYPAVIVGQTSWAPGQNMFLQQYQVSVSVVVQRPGTDDQATIAELETVWPALLAGLQAEVVADQTLGGICAAADVARARPGLIEIQGQRLPAQSIDIDIHG